MTNKNIIIGICTGIALVVVGLLFFFDFSTNSIIENNNQAGNPTPQGKINIDEVCRGALAYTTFPDSQSAEVYVQECKDGKHPDVIERWKVDMGISSDVAI